MSSRNVYTALTPDYADFPVPHTPVTTSALRSQDDFEDEFEDKGSQCARITRLRSQAQDLIKENTGLLLVAASQFFLSLVNVAVKELNGIDPPVPTLELVVVRMSITYVCAMGYMLAAGVPDPILGPKGVRLLLVFRGFIGFFGLFGVYYSLKYLSLSDATVLTFLAPMCTAIAGSVVLGETFTRREALAGIVSLLGVVLIARPAAIFGSASSTESADVAGKSTPTDRLIAVGVAMIGVVGATGAYTTIRAIGKRAHPLHSLTFFSMLSVVVATTGLIVTKTPIVVPTRLDWIALLALIGIFGFTGQVLLTMGLQRETAGRGTMAVYTQIIFATILERIFFHAVPTAFSVIGTVLILSSALYVALTKEKEAPPKSKHVQGRLNISADVELEEGLLDSSHGDNLRHSIDKPERHVRFDVGSQIEPSRD